MAKKNKYHTQFPDKRNYILKLGDVEIVILYPKDCEAKRPSLLGNLQNRLARMQAWHASNGTQLHSFVMELLPDSPFLVKDLDAA